MSTYTMANTYETVETPEPTEQDRQQNFLAQYGWDGSVPYSRINWHWTRSCGANTGALKAAARRDKNAPDRPVGYWDGETWVSQRDQVAKTGKPLTTRRPAAITTPTTVTAPASAVLAALHAVQPTTAGPDYKSLWLAEIRTTAELRAELATLHGLLARHHIAVIRKVS